MERSDTHASSTQALVQPSDAMTPSRPASIRSCPLPTHQPLADGDSKISHHCDPEAQRAARIGTAEEGLAEKSGCPSGNPVWPPWKRTDGWAGWGRESVSTMSLVPCLVVQAFSAGVLDATTYADFHTFASNQTGNTILLTVSALGTIDILLLLTGLSLAAFLLGALIFGHLGHFMGVRRRYWILASSFFQVIMLAVAAILLSPVGPAVTHIGAKHEWVVLVLFANMSGAQVAQARQSGSQELPTAPMTSSYVDLMADKYLFVGFRHPKAGPRNRRLAYLAAMVGGGFLGAVVHRYSGSWEVVVLTLGLKLVVMGMVCFAKADA